MKGVVCSSYSPRKYYYIACITISNTTFHFLLTLGTPTPASTALDCWLDAKLVSIISASLFCLIFLLTKSMLFLMWIQLPGNPLSYSRLSRQTFNEIQWLIQSIRDHRGKLEERIVYISDLMSHTCLLIKLHQSHIDAPGIYREDKKAELKESNLILHFHHFSKILWCSSRKRQECFSSGGGVLCIVLLIWRRELVQRLKAKYLYTGIKNAATSKWNSSLTTNQGRGISLLPMALWLP